MYLENTPQDKLIEIKQSNKSHQMSKQEINKINVKFNEIILNIESLYSTLINKKEPIKDYFEVTLIEIKSNVEELLRHLKSLDFDENVSISNIKI